MLLNEDYYYYCFFIWFCGIDILEAIFTHLSFFPGFGVVMVFIFYYVFGRQIECRVGKPLCSRAQFTGPRKPIM